MKTSLSDLRVIGLGYRNPVSGEISQLIDFRYARILSLCPVSVRLLPRDPAQLAPGRASHFLVMDVSKLIPKFRNLVPDVVSAGSLQAGVIEALNGEEVRSW